MVQALSCKCKCVRVCEGYSGDPFLGVSLCLFVLFVGVCLLFYLFCLFARFAYYLFCLFVFIYSFCKLMYANPIPVISCVPTL